MDACMQCEQLAPAHGSQKEFCVSSEGSKRSPDERSDIRDLPLHALSR
jgi:hypothetical protein